MSITEYKTISELENKRSKLEREKNNLQKKLVSLNNQKETLNQKEKVLRNRTSCLATSTLKNVEKELKELKKEEEQEKKVISKIENEMEETKESIFKLKNDDTLNFYIEECTSIMSSEFIEYIRNNIDNIGAEIKKIYKICPENVIHYWSGYSGGHMIPSGKIGIYDVSIDINDHPLIISKGFNFKEKLYTYADGGVYIFYTDWFKSYYKTFISILNKKIKSKFCFEDLKLTIKNSCITLELV